MSLTDEELLSQRPIVQDRLRDHARVDARQERDALVRIWREAHPEAAREQSAHLRPLTCRYILEPDPRAKPEDPGKPCEEWNNDVYNVTVRRYDKDPVFGAHGGLIQLGISSMDGTARHDWREFQAIKNQLAGAECEAFELYPAESRLLDPSNYYTLWCFPGLKRIKVGGLIRRVFDAQDAFAPQRAWEPTAGAPSAR